jgi:hypothetical protein
MAASQNKVRECRVNAQTDVEIRNPGASSESVDINLMCSYCSHLNTPSSHNTISNKVLCK